MGTLHHRSYLAGHSGAQVAVEHDGERSYVRKMATRPELNARLSKQCEKQASFASSGVAAPHVLGRGWNDDLFYFDMTYVPGISVAKHVCGGNNDMFAAIERLVAGWLTRMRGTQTGTLPGETFSNKVNSIYKNCAGNPVASEFLHEIATIRHKLVDYPWPDAPASECHGDFTLENILISNDRQLLMIDFDVPDICSYWMDIGKLYQISWALWCARQELMSDEHSVNSRNASLSLYGLRCVIDRVIQASDARIAPHTPRFRLLNLMRTLPYCRDVPTLEFVLSRIKAVLSRCQDPVDSGRCSIS